MSLITDKFLRSLARGFLWNKPQPFQWLEFLVPSTLNLSKSLELLLDQVTCSETVQKIKLGLHEALVNAARHGNKEDPDKLIRVRFVMTPNWWIWQIQDEGTGTPYKQRLGVLPLKLDSNSGRGLFLIHHSFDDVRWSNRGNRIQLATRRVNRLMI